MSPSDPAPVSSLVRLVGLVGLLGLAALTLVDRGATRMYATPWTLVFAAVLAAPLLALVLRVVSPAPVIRLPSLPWGLLAAAIAFIPLASAWLSPYREASLLSAAVPVAAAGAFLLGADWLATDPARHRARLENIFAGAAIVIALASTVYWLDDLTRHTRADLLSPVFFEIRNPHPLGHSNYTAGLMLLSLPWLAQAAGRARGVRRTLMIIAIGLALLNLFTSGSRGGLLGLAGLVFAGVALAGVGWKRFLLIAGGAVVLTALLAVANPRIRHLLVPPDPQAEPNASTVQRTAMLEIGLALGRDRPLLGWGPGTVPLAYPCYRHTVAGGAENVLQLHSIPVQLWAETGGAGLLAALVGVALVFLHRARAPVAAATLAGYGIFSLTDYQLDVPAFAGALAVVASMLAPTAAAAASRGSRFLVAGCALVSVAMMAGWGARDQAPVLNGKALALACDPAQNARAVALLNQSLALNPDQEIAHFNLGWLLVVSDPATAEQHFRAAARLVPDKGGVYFGLGLALLNQGDPAGAARALALECVNEPLFLASPWWNVPEIAAERAGAAAAFGQMLATAQASPLADDWTRRQAGLLATLGPRLGQVSPGPEVNYRRERTGYPVLMRNLDLVPPLDLYDVREDPRFPASVPFPLPHKGWLPSPLLLNLLDEPPPVPQ